MRVCQISLFVVMAWMGASQAMAESGLPSQAALDAMGLSDLRVMSDVEGLSVRGLGYNGASAYGHSWAIISSNGASAGSKNGYKASGKYLAGGHNESEAELEIEVSGGNHGGGYGNKKSNGSYGGGNKGGGHSSKPKSIEIEVSAGGSSIGFRK